ncbi:nucleoside diphosphate kinase regulator [Sinisalibacter aestuarii]|uniref:Nucleoside diphosphate kinase regulator n=1 Tax=Sinisalibacter aestuarii TaxID=2949426 RepID=A0ABQ5LRD0_9RHOB|nr:nucleoside diphosphate kinase regulator [Sinisalibacter aestuarii]GKY87489.1 nucleoside diphosphate kinase regulator [Sinisalibacter aestuarii]
MTTMQIATRTASRRRPKVVISDDCLDHLEALAQGAYQRNPDLAERLLEELGRARIVPAGKLPADVVTIGRRVTYRDETTGEEATVIPVYPEQADIARGRISVLTPIGVALIGLAEGACLPWRTRSGETRQLRVLHVVDDDTGATGGG